MLQFGSTSHLIRLCPHVVKNRYTEAPGRKGNESMDSNCVSTIGVTRESSQNNYNKDCESRDDIGGELDEIIAIMHDISSDNVMHGISSIRPDFNCTDRSGGGNY